MEEILPGDNPVKLLFNSTEDDLILEMSEIAADDEHKIFSNIIKSRYFGIGFKNNSPIPRSIKINFFESFNVVFRIKNVRYPIRVYHDRIIHMYETMYSLINLRKRNEELGKQFLDVAISSLLSIITTIISTECDVMPNIINFISMEIPNLTFIDVKRKPPVQTLPPAQDDDSLESLVKCVICMEENVGNVSLQPCQHKIMCKDCMEQLQNWVCPVCRCPILNIIVQ